MMDITKLMGKRPAIEITAEATESLAALESTIERGLASFHAVGHALKTIRDKQLYSQKYRSFTEYLSARWAFSTVHAQRLIEAADVVDGLIASGVLKLPALESHARVLAKIAPEQRAEVWQAATAEIDDNGLTAEALEETVAKLAPRAASKKPRARKKPKTITIRGKVGKVGYSLKLERKGHCDATEALQDALNQLQSRASRAA